MRFSLPAFALLLLVGTVSVTAEFPFDRELANTSCGAEVGFDGSDPVLCSNCGTNFSMCCDVTTSDQASCKSTPTQGSSSTSSGNFCKTRTVNGVGSKFCHYYFSDPLDNAATLACLLTVGDKDSCESCTPCKLADGGPGVITSCDTTDSGLTFKECTPRADVNAQITKLADESPSAAFRQHNILLRTALGLMAAGMLSLM